MSTASRIPPEITKSAFRVLDSFRGSKGWVHANLTLTVTLEDDKSG